ncbi:dihydroxyacetone kinase [Microbacterium sp. Leaf288]|uniref:dihydroxyacetone kinase subunit DhaK n=1 Tax=Microbacterium sp. Leaf288 TaxID=1736323 RepID=UPI000702385E|nr:dihydroxyacetone kinase subunit DhaK [Microbacterium sp. Leaf288]KQP69394.1 dihydroxyacetone kinase [Microbacterium sp. Leaf288]
MTVQLHDDPAELVADAIRGLVSAHPTIVSARFDPLFVIRADSGAPGTVAVVSGGGSGHEPLHAGFVGSGMLDAAVPGQVFASPTAGQVHAALVAADRGAGVVLIIKNYTGDVLNFTLAAEDARDDGLSVELVLVDDDLATDGENSGTGRRGTAATVVAEKLAGAAAREGRSLGEVAAVARGAAERSRSLAVGFRSATLPGHDTPSFELQPGELEFGVGIHGERGTGRTLAGNGSEIVASLVRPLVDALGLSEGDEIIAVVNGLGGTAGVHLGAARHYLDRALEGTGIRIARSLVGSYVTALEMQGISITLTRITDGDLELWDAPVTTAALRW